ncbi:MAG: hypothetical protein A2W28_01335 [Gammaproteobacteria bacterium RBG_16_51_14]|nr:MAG: hypothetical protein A2W28_01335 [Gammaproteobacteria bacterium RBG_16_51_14]
MITRNITFITVMLICICPSTTLCAETAYIVDSLMAGLHADKSSESTILKVIPTGTELKILDQDGNYTHVEDPDGDKGWVDNTYLMKERPARQVLQEAQEKNRNLEVDLENTKLRISELEERLAQGTDADNPGIDPKQHEALVQENSTLQQQFKSERLKVGELQARITELRKNIARSDNSAPLQDQIEQLKLEKQALQQQLDSRDTAETVSGSTFREVISSTDWRAKLTFIGIVLITGIIIGAYLLDYFYRRRHGGFRV